MTTGELSFDGPEFGVVPTEVFSDKRLSHGASRVLGLLFAYRNRKTHLAWPGQQALADGIGVDRATVNGYLKECKEAGWISVEKRGQGKTNVYTVHWTPDSRCCGEATSRSSETHVDQDGNIPVNIPDPAPENGAGDKPRQPAHPAVQCWKHHTGYRPLPQGRDILTGLWDLYGEQRFQELAADYVAAGKNPRNLGYFRDWCLEGGVNGTQAREREPTTRRPGVRNTSYYSPEEKRKAREADRGQEWQPPPE